MFKHYIRTRFPRLYFWLFSDYNLRFETQIEHERRTGGLYFTDTKEN